MRREPIYDAIYNRLLSLGNFVIVSRRLRPYEDVSPAEQPAVYIVSSGKETATTKRGIPSVWRLGIDLYIYARNTGDPYVSPSVELNQLLDDVDQAILFDPLKDVPGSPEGNFNDYQNVYHTTLMGLVSHLWITNIERFDGTVDGQSAAIVHLEALTV